MFSLTFIVLLFIFTFASFLFLILYLYVSYLAVKEKPTYFNQFKLSSHGSTQISILHRVSKIDELKQQLDDIVELMGKYFDTNMNYEIICLFDDFNIKDYIKSLKIEYPCLNGLYCETSGIRWLTNGVHISCGELICDSRFLSQQIMHFNNILNDQIENIIYAIEPIGSGLSNLYDNKDYSLISVMKRKTAFEVLSKLHMLDYGFIYELLLISKHLNIEIKFIKQRLGDFEIPFFEILITYLTKKIINIMYKFKIW